MERLDCDPERRGGGRGKGQGERGQGSQRAKNYGCQVHRGSVQRDRGWKNGRLEMEVRTGLPGDLGQSQDAAVAVGSGSVVKAERFFKDRIWGS